MSFQKTNPRNLPPDEVPPQSPLAKRLTSSRLWITIFSVAFTAVFLAIFIPACRRHRDLAYILEQDGRYELTDENLWMTERYGDFANGFRGVNYVSIGHTTDEALAHLATLSDVARLSCFQDESRRCVLSSHGMDSLSRLVNLEEIEFAGSQFTDELLADFFSSHPKLTSVGLRHTQAGRQTLNALARIQSIERLNLSGISFASGVFPELDPLSNLETVSISIGELPNSGAEWLSRCTRLRELHLGRTQVTDAVLAQLSTLPALEVLSLSHSTQVTEAGIEHITALSQLKILQLPAHVLTYHTLDLLGQMPSLIEVTTSEWIHDDEVRTYFYNSWSPMNAVTSGTP